MLLDVKLWSDSVFASLLVSGKYHPLKSHYFYAELVLLNPVVVSTKAFKAASCSVSAATCSPVKRRDIWKAEELKAFLHIYFEFCKNICSLYLQSYSLVVVFLSNLN